MKSRVVRRCKRKSIEIKAIYKMIRQIVWKCKRESIEIKIIS